jgi:alpha-tubulin suppressor-like RCC1 family protein
VQIGALTTWASVGIGNYNVLAVKTDGTLWAWGAADAGALGNGTSTPNLSSPVQIGALTDWAQVAAGNAFSLAIKTNGTVWNWGINTTGQLGNGGTTTTSSPVQVDNGSGWTKISAGTLHSHLIGS